MEMPAGRKRRGWWPPVAWSKPASAWAHGDR